MVDDVQERALAEIKASRRRSDRLLDRTVMVPVRRSYDEYIGRVVSGLGRLFKRRTRDIATSDVVVSMISFVQQMMPGLSSRISDVLFTANRDTTVEGIRSTSRFINLVQRMATPLEDALTMSRIALVRRQSMKDFQRRAAEALSNDLTGALTRRIQKAPFLEMRIAELISETGIGLDDEWWRTERTVRTATSAIYNGAQSDAIAAVALEPEFRGMMSRWTELVDDVTGVPFDNRVGTDSIALHGQVARPGGLFTMPPAPDVSDRLIGRSWSHPPNRPNDRALLTPWLPEWKIPGWLWQAGRRVSLGPRN